MYTEESWAHALVTSELHPFHAGAVCTAHGPVVFVCLFLVDVML